MTDKFKKLESNKSKQEILDKINADFGYWDALEASISADPSNEHLIIIKSRKLALKELQDWIYTG